MVEKYDVISITRENMSGSGLAEGSEHYVAFACKECEMIGIILNELGEEELVIFIPTQHVKVIGEANSNMTRRYIDDVENKHNLRKCGHL